MSELKVEVILPEGKTSLTKEEIEDLYITPYASMVDKTIESLKSRIRELEAQVELLKKKLEIAEKALRFYAEEKHMERKIEDGTTIAYLYEDGKIAQKALEEISEVK